MKKDFYMEIDEKYYKFVNLFSRFQNEIETYYRYYEWSKSYGDFSDLEAKDKFGRRVGDIIDLTHRSYEKIAFEKNKHEFISLAHEGSLHATMIYLFMENPINWDKKIVSEIEKIEEKQEKTPEMLGCIAGLHRRDYAYAFGDENVSGAVKNVYNLCEIIADNWYEYNYAACVGYHAISAEEEQRVGDCAALAMNCYKQLKMYSTKYVEALGEMQKAFYSRFLSAKKAERNYFDVSVLLKTKSGFPDEIFAPGVVNWKEFAELSNGKYYSFGRFGSILNHDKALKRMSKYIKKNEALKPAYEVKQVEFASAALVVGKHNFGATTTLKRNVLDKAMKYISQMADKSSKDGEMMFGLSSPDSQPIIEK